MTTPAASPLTLSPKQERSIAESTARLNIWSGAIRSGKTIASLLRWLVYIAQAPRGGSLVIVGKTNRYWESCSRSGLGDCFMAELVSHLALSHAAWSTCSPPTVRWARAAR